jgi:ATP-dependent exoDNAse (exonuclease V) alpha subunit
MVGTRDLHRLAGHVVSGGGALVLVGDPDQHGAVETGGVFRALVASNDELGLTLFANNRQQKERDRRAIDLFREGNVEAALSRYDDDDLVVRSATAAESYDRMVEDWWEHTRRGGSDPMIVGTNHARKQLNAKARQRLVAAGHVSGRGVPGRDGADLAVGDWVVARRNNPRITSPSSEAICNGDHGRVTAVDPTAGTIVVDIVGKGSMHLPKTYVADHVQHGYARTTYGVQGATLDRAFVHVDDRTGFEEAYVAMTRGRNETRLYLVDGTARVAAAPGRWCTTSIRL